MSEPVNATYQGSLTVCGVTLECYVTEDGMRIFDAKGVQELLTLLSDGRDVSQEDAESILAIAKHCKIRSKVSP